MDELVSLIQQKAWIGLVFYLATVALNILMRLESAEEIVAYIAKVPGGAYVLATIRTMGGDPVKLVTMAKNLLEKNNK